MANSIDPQKSYRLVFECYNRQRRVVRIRMGGVSASVVRRALFMEEGNDGFRVVEWEEIPEKRGRERVHEVSSS